jgi:hypothetical protein
MMKNMIILFGYALFFCLLITACSSTKLSLVYMDEAYNGGPVWDILIIGVTDEEGVRRSFENRFVGELTAVGVEAVSSFDLYNIPEDKKLEKEDILRVIDEQENNAVIITRLIGVDRKEVLEPIVIFPHWEDRGYYNYYYNYYNHAFDHAYGGVYRTHTFVKLETNLYNAKTEELIWSGRSKTWNPKSDAKLLDEVIKTVIKDLEKKGLIKAK